ncbi:MAG: IclR family transcriptional regulator C-terminal domain-containing protein [Opitutales bacterium]|nr:IclR family transcriptional regulator C-terminal domain-containing protein [Opitutales bacterium]
MTSTPIDQQNQASILFRKGDPNFMNSLARGIAVLSAFSDNSTGLKMTHLSDRTGLSRAVVRRCLYTLEQLGYVRKSTDGFHLEPKVISLSQTYFSASPLTTQAQEFLDRVKDATGESCSLAMLDEDEVVYVARSAAKKVIDLTLGIGSRLPTYCSSLGRVLLADYDDEDILSRLKDMDRVKRTKYTKTEINELLEVIRESRYSGYSLVNQELEIGLRSISVPVRNQNQRVIAAMTVGVQAMQTPQRTMETEILPILRSASKELGSQLIC